MKPLSNCSNSDGSDLLPVGTVISGLESAEWATFNENVISLSPSVNKLTSALNIGYFCSRAHGVLLVSVIVNLRIVCMYAFVSPNILAKGSKYPFVKAGMFRYQPLQDSREFAKCFL